MVLVHCTILKRLYQTPEFPRKHQPHVLAEVGLGGWWVSNPQDDGWLLLRFATELIRRGAL